MLNTAVPVVGFAAWSGSGKTTLLVRTLPLLKGMGLRVGVVKHAHHDFEIDYPGKDSYELRKAGATQMLVGSRKRWALIAEPEAGLDPRLETLLGYLHLDELDLVLVEGFKPEGVPKIEVFRPSLGQPLLAPEDPGIVAIATDDPGAVPLDLPLLDINTPGEVARFLVDRFLTGHEAAEPSADADAQEVGA